MFWNIVNPVMQSWIFSSHYCCHMTLQKSFKQADLGLKKNNQDAFFRINWCIESFGCWTSKLLNINSGVGNFISSYLNVSFKLVLNMLLLAYRKATAPSYFDSLMTIYIPSRSLRSASEQRLVVPSQRGTKSLSRTFSFTVPGWWNELPTPIRNAESLTIFKRHLKTHLFRLHLTSAS